ncbi:MAG: Flp pilus assembly pilin Flp [Candidatus Omnitrophota bacterium]|jgi:Flp pilus assembly pilin Flp
MKRSLLDALREIVPDERGQAMTEYIIITALMAVLAMWLYNPHNPVFESVRDLFQNIFAMLVMLGP